MSLIKSTIAAPNKTIASTEITKFNIFCNIKKSSRYLSNSNSYKALSNRNAILLVIYYRRN